MGEAKRKQVVQQELLAVDTFGGRVQLRWEEEAAGNAAGATGVFCGVSQGERAV